MLNEQAKFYWDNRPDAAAQALHDVMAERHRQMMVEGWTAQHDDEHSNGSMAYAAAAYAVASVEQADSLVAASNIFARTGWAKRWWKPRTPREDLVRATALLLAEIERRDRAAAKAAYGAEASFVNLDTGELLNERAEPLNPAGVTAVHEGQIIAFLCGAGMKLETARDAAPELIRMIRTAGVRAVDGSSPE